MKIKCLLKCTVESNGYGTLFIGRTDREQLTPEEFQLWEAEGCCEEESWPASRRSACAVTGKHRVQMNASIQFSTCVYFILSDKLRFLPLLLLAIYQITSWQWESCFRGDGNYQCTSQTVVKGAVQTHLKKHSWKNFNLLDLDLFVFRSTPVISIKFWNFLNRGTFMVYHHPK